MSALRVCGTILAILAGGSLFADDHFDAQWILVRRGRSGTAGAAGKVWFRREVRADEPSTGAARVLCDDRFTLWVNGRKIGERDAGRSIDSI